MAVPKQGARPLRILNVIRFPLGGIRSYLRYTYSRLDSRCYTSTIITVDIEEARLLPGGMAPLAVELKTVSETHAFARLSVATDSLLRSRAFDLVHSQGSTAAVVADLSARRYRVPHVITLHETFRADQFAGMLGGAKRLLLTRALSRANSVITVSDDARENLMQHLRLDSDVARRVEVIRNGVAVDMLMREAPQNRLDVRATCGVGQDVVLLGYVGRFMPEKGFDVLIQAVRQLQEHPKDVPKFLVVALNDGAFVREYRQRVAELGLHSCFHFAGFRTSAAGMLTELDAVIMPSLREACPLVAMEAMVLGCPLIASDCIGLRELTAGTPAVQSRTGDPRSLAAGIRHFLENRATIQSQAQAYVAPAQRLFDSNQSAESLTAIFRRALSARH